MPVEFSKVVFNRSRPSGRRDRPLMTDSANSMLLLRVDLCYCDRVLGICFLAQPRIHPTGQKETFGKL